MSAVWQCQLYIDKISCLLDLMRYAETMIRKGEWGKGNLNGSVQRAITYGDKTVIIDVETGQL